MAVTTRARSADNSNPHPSEATQTTNPSSKVVTTTSSSQSPLTLMSHRLPPHDTPTFTDRLLGATAITLLLACMTLGPLIPLVILCLALCGYGTAAATAATLALISLAVAVESPLICRCYLRAAGYFTNGVTAHYERRTVDSMKASPSLWCMHPHGTAIGFGFTLNGAVRFRACDEDRFVPPEAEEEGFDVKRMRLANGVQAPVLFYLPLLRNVLLAFGCCTPATKAGMCGLLSRGEDFGMLPGGMEEVALFRQGRERVFLKQRAGFIKYALQYGYLVQPAYTFGESDLYRSMTAGARVRMYTLKRWGFVVPVFWGPYWWAPWLPRADVALNTVIGSPLQLPRIENPTSKDVAKYHSMYIASLVEIFDTYKERFGYGDRELEVV